MEQIAPREENRSSNTFMYSIIDSTNDKNKPFVLLICLLEDLPSGTEHIPLLQTEEIRPHHVEAGQPEVLRHRRAVSPRCMSW